jgi:acyl-CoA synthetase (AMP-forming)/AMP-acid ligase II
MDMEANGDLQQIGDVGEIVIKGENVMHGYNNNPEANAEAFVRGWFRTGDQGFLNSDSYLTLTGRIKELINRGGEKISPLEIDGVLLKHPSVAEAVCFAVPDEKYGEVVHAAVVLRGEADQESIRTHCRDQMADFKVPDVIYIADQLPRTVTGKIQRRHMMAAFVDPK